MAEPIPADAAPRRAATAPPRFTDPQDADDRIRALMTPRQMHDAARLSAVAVRQFPHSSLTWQRHGQISERLLSDEPDHSAGYAEIALRCFRTAAERDPANADAAAGIARLLDRQGDADGARAALEPHLGLDPPNAEVAMAFARLAARSHETDRALAMIARAIGHRETVRLHHAHARLLDRAGRHAESFAAARRGNQLVAEAQLARGFEPGTLAKAVDGLIRATPRSVMMAAPAASHRSEVPVFIVGMGRSGSTLVEQIVSGHPQAHGGGERRAITRAIAAIGRLTGVGEAEGVGQWPVAALDRVNGEFLRELQALAPGAARITDKLPQNFLRLAVIQRLLPGARIIHTQRSPLDVCLSAYYQEQKIPVMEPWDLYRAGLAFRQYERLMAHWRQVLDLPILDVQYENLVTRPEIEARRILAFLELPWDPACLAVERNRRIVDTSNYQSVRQPIHGEAVGRWRQYEKELAPLMRALAGGSLPAEN